MQLLGIGLTDGHQTILRRGRGGEERRGGVGGVGKGEVGLYSDGHYPRLKGGRGAYLMKDRGGN